MNNVYVKLFDHYAMYFSQEYFIVHPNMYALKPALISVGVDVLGIDAEICGRVSIRDWLFVELREKNMQEPIWKGYERAANLIIDPVEWTIDNDMLILLMKVKLRNLFIFHDETIKTF